MFDTMRRMLMPMHLTILGIKHGKGFSCAFPIYLHADTGIIQVGDNLSISHNVTIAANDGGEITIGNNVAIGMNTVLRAANHDYIKLVGHIPGKIVIGDNVWIGANCVIVPGVSIGSGSVIGAGSIVTKDIPDNVVAVGNPCKPIKKIVRGICGGCDTNQQHTCATSNGCCKGLL